MPDPTVKAACASAPMASGGHITLTVVPTFTRS